MSEITYTCEFQINPGAADKFAALAQDCSDYVKQNEPGTIGYAWSLGDDGHTCHLIERFTDSRAAIAHLGGGIVSDLLPKLLETCEMKGIDVHGDVSADLAKAIEPFPTRTFRTLRA